ncbi:C40 family peptidase [Streptomyces guryensis]|uniref:NlpC/P60 family protein n=1 Tax=Streptomyces guryensis TaxID=2886947 RepID=A0A9Q3VUV9_9ACTN|nr:C40 family peptidase [Streptomyces guryensis]MCD9878044.1 NlpC/P60 family protein [Streptomyces guryensis]
MSGKLLRLVCTVAMAAGALLVPPPAAAVPGPEPGTRTVAAQLTDLQRLYREAEKAAETYNATAEKLTKQRAEVARLDRELAGARRSLHDSRVAAGRLARQQYQGSTEISAYVRLLLARNPQQALDEGHVIGRLARERSEAVDRQTESEKKATALARAARTALDAQLALAERQKKDRDDVQARLEDVEKALASLTPEQLAALGELEKQDTDRAQQRLMASGTLSREHRPSRAGARALGYAVRQLGKPYRWGAQGPKSYDCSGLTSQAWGKAGRPIPRTSQEQWAQLPRVPLKKLRPGDLVIYFPDATHVAMYLGEGMMIQAPRTGERVKVSPVASYPILGAVRPDQRPEDT